MRDRRVLLKSTNGTPGTLTELKPHGYPVLAVRIRAWRQGRAAAARSIRHGDNGSVGSCGCTVADEGPGGPWAAGLKALPPTAEMGVHEASQACMGPKAGSRNTRALAGGG